VLRGRVSLYEARGDFQIIVEHMEEAGEGILKRQFEALKRKLNAEGLFDAQIKQPLPRLPTRIGVISSPTGAALRDILSVLKRRFPTIPVLIYPTKVQGDTAAQEIAATIALANQRQDCDVLILARGGGSLEDLWAFNEEVLARAIYAGTIPLIAGVGHEVDVTIADFVADVRAPTPTAAAELVVPDQQEWLARINELGRRLDRVAGQNLDQIGQHLGQLQHRLARCHPGRRLSELTQRLDQAELSLGRSLSHVLSRAQERLRLLQRALAGQHPGQRLAAMGLRITELERRLGRGVATHLEKYQQRLGLVVRGLSAVSPLATLERGYAIVTDGDSLIQTTDQLKVNQNVEVRLTQGSFEAEVKRLKRPD